jgi:hypothetical protein
MGRSFVFFGTNRTDAGFIAIIGAAAGAIFAVLAPPLSVALPYTPRTKFSAAVAVALVVAAVAAVQLND